MTRVFSSPDWMLVQTLRTVLESYGLACEVQGEFRGSAAGEIPPAEAWSELWILDDDRVAEAKAILDRQRVEPGQQPTWTCPRCGEELEGQFDRCWRCGHSR